MDEKRELLMQLLFGSEDTAPAVPDTTQHAARLQKWTQAQKKAEKINETLADSQRSAAILRKMMRGE